jgi:hypothetical protein
VDSAARSELAVDTLRDSVQLVTRKEAILRAQVGIVSEDLKDLKGRVESGGSSLWQRVERVVCETPRDVANPRRKGSTRTSRLSSNAQESASEQL